MKRSSLCPFGDEMTPAEKRRIAAWVYFTLLGGPFLVFIVGGWIYPEQLTYVIGLLGSCRGLVLDLGAVVYMIAMIILGHNMSG